MKGTMLKFTNQFMHCFNEVLCVFIFVMGSMTKKIDLDKISEIFNVTIELDSNLNIPAINHFKIINKNNF